MTEIGRPSSEEPLEVPAPWEWSEPKPEIVPEPEQEPAQV